MKYLISLVTILSFASIAFGYFGNSEYSEKFIGFGVVGIFLVAVPLFSFYRWKGKNMKDYIINNENLKKMRDNEKRH